MYIPIISATLPPPGGKFATGYATLRLPAAVPYMHPVPKRADGSAAMQLSESVVAVYYPTVAAAPSSWNPFAARPSVAWLPDGRVNVLEGYDRFLHGRFGKLGWWIGE
jgi:hypothetical protein